MQAKQLLYFPLYFKTGNASVFSPQQQFTFKLGNERDCINSCAKACFWKEEKENE